MRQDCIGKNWKPTGEYTQNLQQYFFQTYIHTFIHTAYNLQTYIYTFIEKYVAKNNVITVSMKF